jgi:hypothetical protein
MNYCGPKGIPLSTFLGWSIDDQVAALGWQAEQNLRCRSCGTAAWEWELDPDAYGIRESICKGCSLIAAATKSADEKVAGMKFSRSELMPGLQIGLIRRQPG